jgi:D-serine deaminase-like pyridoxal phosphate-dependent protein
MERNLATMARSLQRFPHLRLRAHAKAHKTAFVVDQQLQHGAVGICCQKLDEVEALLCSRAADILISNEVVGDLKVARLASLVGPLPASELCGDRHPPCF